MDKNVFSIWVYLSTSPLVGLTITMLAYTCAYTLYKRFNSHPLLHPVLIAIIFLIGFITVTDTPYSRYFEGAQFIHFLLGPATVALAIPLYQQWSKLKGIWVPITVSIVLGSAVAVLSSISLALLFGASKQSIYIVSRYGNGKQTDWPENRKATADIILDKK